MALHINNYFLSDIPANSGSCRVCKIGRIFADLHRSKVIKMVGIRQIRGHISMTSIPFIAVDSFNQYHILSRNLFVEGLIDPIFRRALGIIQFGNIVWSLWCTVRVMGGTINADWLCVRDVLCQLVVSDFGTSE